MQYKLPHTVLYVWLQLPSLPMKWASIRAKIAGGGTGQIIIDVAIVLYVVGTTQLLSVLVLYSVSKIYCFLLPKHCFNLLKRLSSKIHWFLSYNLTKRSIL